MLHNREFLFGLAAVGVAQFAWTLANAVLLLAPSPWVLGTVPGMVVAGVATLVATAIAVARRDEAISFGKAWLWTLTGVYLGMALTVVLLAGGRRIVFAILFGMGALLPPLAAGAVAGEVARRIVARRRAA